MTTTLQRILTTMAQPLALRYAERYGNLKSVLSAGIVAFDKLSAEQKEKMLDEASGLQSEDPSQKAAEGVRYFIKIMRSMNEKDRAITLQFLSPEECKMVKNMLPAPAPQSPPSKHGTSA